MTLRIKNVATIAEIGAKWLKIEKKPFVSAVEKSKFDLSNLDKLKFINELKTDIVEIAKPKKYNFDLSTSNLSCSVSNSKIDEIFLSGCGRGCKGAHGIVDTEKFRDMTGMQLVVGDNISLRPFRKGVDVILHQIDEGIFPKDFKGVLVGHGKGSFADGTWSFSNNKNVLDFISAHFNQGDKVLCLTCETAKNATAKAWGIGNPVDNTLTNITKPAKIVEVGKGIVGHFVNARATYY